MTRVLRAGTKVRVIQTDLFDNDLLLKEGNILKENADDKGDRSIVVFQSITGVYFRTLFKDSLEIIDNGTRQTSK